MNAVFQGQEREMERLRPLTATQDFGAVLREIKSDPTGTFWG